MNAICDFQDRALAERRAGRLDDAERSLRAALRLLEEAGEGRHPDAANLACELSDLLCALRRDGEAEALARSAVEIVEDALDAFARVDGLDPADGIVLERIRLESLARLVCALRGQGRYPQARPFALRAVQHAARSFGARSPEAAARWNDLGVLYKYQGALSKAARAYARARAIFETEPEVDPGSLGTVLYNLGGLAHARGDYADAETMILAALQRLVPAFGHEHPDVGAGHSTHAAILVGLRRWDDAERAYRGALAIFEAAYGEDHPDVALVFAGLAQVERGRGAADRAEALARRALGLRRRLLGSGHPQVVHSVEALATLCAELGRRAEGRSLARAELAASRERNGAEHPSTVQLYRTLAALEGAADA
jgi:tetratricopeptide (TPR) repeat protein